MEKWESLFVKLKNYTVFFYFLSNPINRKHLYLKILTNNKAVMSITNHISCGFAKLEFEEAEIIVGLVIHQPKKWNSYPSIDLSFLRY